MKGYRIFDCEDMEYVGTRVYRTLAAADRECRRLMAETSGMFVPDEIKSLWRDIETGEWYMHHKDRVVRLKFGYRREPV